MGETQRGILLFVVTSALVLGSAFTNIPLRLARMMSISDLLATGNALVCANACGEEIVDAAQQVAGDRQVGAQGATKIVPIYAVGRSTPVGAAQITGEPRQIRHVMAVAAVELRKGAVHGMGLIPITTPRPTGDTLDRVDGVGITSILEYRLKPPAAAHKKITRPPLHQAQQ